MRWIQGVKAIWKWRRFVTFGVLIKAAQQNIPSLDWTRYMVGWDGKDVSTETSSCRLFAEKMLRFFRHRAVHEDIPVYLVVGGCKSQLVLAGADGKVGDGAHVTLNAKRLRRGNVDRV